MKTIAFIGLLLVVLVNSFFIPQEFDATIPHGTRVDPNGRNVVARKTAVRDELGGAVFLDYQAEIHPWVITLV
jgi:hypothetical protein